MTYLITGGSGFIGTHLGLALQQAGESFRIVDKSPSQTFPERVALVDILDADRLAQALTGETIFHLAAEHRDDVQPADLYTRVNVEGTRNLCRAARLRGIDRIIFTSSVAVYGFVEAATDETGAINPFNAYGRSKYDAEQVLRAWAAEAPLTRSLTIIRPTVVFGAGNRGNVYTLFRQIALIDLSTSFHPGMIGSFYGGAFLCFAAGFFGAWKLFNRPLEEAVTTGFA